MTDIEQRKAELEALDWQGLKKIAQNLGIEKRDGEEWRDTIPQIIEKQAADPVAAKYIPPPPDVEIPEPEPLNDDKPIHPTYFYESAGIEFCPQCGEKKRTRANKPFCPQNLPLCPMMQQG